MLYVNGIYERKGLGPNTISCPLLYNYYYFNDISCIYFRDLFSFQCQMAQDCYTIS